MKKLIGVFALLLVGLQVTAQIAYVNDGGSLSNLTGALNTINNEGKIVVTGVVTLDAASVVEIPADVALEFIPGGRFVLPNAGLTLNVRGPITSGTQQIFQVLSSAHNVRVFDQPVYAAWFGSGLDLSAALNAMNGTGTVVVDQPVEVGTVTSIPKDMVLRFEGEGMLEFPNSGDQLDVLGRIEAHREQVFDLTHEDHGLRIHSAVVYPEWFGPCGEAGRTTGEDDVPIQKAFNALVKGGEIQFLGKLYVLKDGVSLSAPAVVVRGKEIYHASDESFNLITGSDDAVLSATDAYFNIENYGVRIMGLAFKGEGLSENHKRGVNAEYRAISYVKSDDGKDLDAAVQNCHFANFETCIYARGANLKVVDNFFGNSIKGIFIQEALSADVDHSGHTRGHVISRNRFHSLGSYSKDASVQGSACIKLIHEQGVTATETLPSEAYVAYGFSNQITDNHADDCKTFFEGSVDKTLIDGNSIQASGGTAIKAFAGDFGTITNNKIDGITSWRGNSLYYFHDAPNVDFPDGHGIHIRYANFITVQGNSISNKRKHGIYIEKSKNSVFQMNSIYNFNRHSHVKVNGSIVAEEVAAYDGIHVAYNATPYNIDNVITNNTIGMPHTSLRSRFAIYVGDDDPRGLVRDNSILMNWRIIGDVNLMPHAPGETLTCATSACDVVVMDR